MLRTRVLTAGVMMTVFLAALLLADGMLFAPLIAAIIGVGGYEWARLCALRTGLAVPYAALAAAAVIALLWAPGDARLAVYAGAAVFWLLLAPAWLALGIGQGRRALLLAAGLAALVPAGLAAAALPPLSMLGVLALVWIADTAAYFTGRAFGRHALAPSISPRKTWEGVGGALLGSLVYAAGCALLVPQLDARVQGVAWLWYLGAAALLCAAGVVGDLFESALKRQASAKDSGALLPGHGGVLDRIDSATAALPLAAILLYVAAPR